MNLKQFITWAQAPARPIVNYLGNYPGECVSLISQYLALVFGLRPGAWGNAVDYWTRPVREVLDNFDKIQTRDFLDGDILVWGDDAGSMTGPFGHLAIWFNGKIWNQNWNNQKFVTENYFFPDGFLGVLRPKNQSLVAQKVIATEVLSSDFYEIQAGDTFWDLEIRYNIPHGTLQQLNQGQDPRKLQIGQKIRIRGGDQDGQNSEKTYYTIKAGDTFWGLENAWQLPHGTLQRLNLSTDAKQLQIGQRIRIK